ncbi:cilia- and flagella-associated protein 91 isoform X1 [Hypomesus transpacificus]|uniref:cilia- and flagella-associated protein 91 isoform X1 n=1 Tax=Hypomesus transpacificus TaxID=137520 RepID=UPI001F07132B|nr:cilia- and flagella-associated protein 91 isoform X1 [Hypomesus transpacificus]
MSFSVTRTFHKQHEGNTGFRQQRVHDYLYDPVYTVSGEIDHARASFKAHASVDRVRRVPEFGSMFSHLPHYPRYALCLDTTDPVPAFIDRRWRGHTERRKETLQQLAGTLPGGHLHARGTEHGSVTGAERWKFFKRPLIPFSQQVPADVVFALPKAKSYSTEEKGTERPLTPVQRTVGVQTDYRDSEAQTDPYTPEYVVRPGTAPPELLTLATLTWGRGLPAGLAEVEMIERARAKRAWEATLPPLNDLSQLDKRRRMMDQMERKEWAFREDEIQKLQEARLALLMELLQQREESQEETKVQRLDLKYSQLQADKQARLQKIHNNYVLSLRKLTAKRRNVEGKLECRDIIRDYTDYSSQTYAPLSRMGLFLDRPSQSHVVRSRYHDTYEGLVELEAGLPASVMEPRVKAPKPKTSKGFLKCSARREMELMKTHQALKEKKERVEEKKPLRFLFKREKPAPRPETPVVDEPPHGDEERELAVIFLQKLLRGRSIQNQMFEGKEKRLELIQELRTTHALQREEQELQKADMQLTLALQRQRDAHTHTASAVEGYQAGVAGAELVDMLDFLSKELIRLQEERRIHAFTLLAERDRRLREAEESGRRQVEERRRREEDEIFRQVVRVHQETVDLYLEDIILGTLEQTADEQAREEIRRQAQEVNNIAHALEDIRSNLQSEEIVAELVYSFLIPEVQKTSVMDRVRQSQRRHLQAAHQIIHGASDSSGAPLGPLGTPRPSSPSDRASRRLLEEMLCQVQQHEEQERGANREEK